MSVPVEEETPNLFLVFCFLTTKMFFVWLGKEIISEPIIALTAYEFTQSVVSGLTCYVMWYFGFLSLYRIRLVITIIGTKWLYDCI